MFGKEYLGYLEHQTPELLNMPTANVGKGGCTIFSQILEKRCGYGFQGLPWCTTFVFAVHPNWNRLGPPCAGVREMWRRMKKYGLRHGRNYAPKVGDIVFLRTGLGRIGHCGIIVDVTETHIISIDGNTQDPSGVFEKSQGGAVALRRRNRKQIQIAGYAEIKGGLK